MSRAASDFFAELLGRHRPTVSGPAGVVTCEPGWSWRFSGLHDFDVWAVRDGSGRAVVDGLDVALGPGTVLLLRPGLSGRAEQDPGRRLTVHYCHFTFGPGRDDGSGPQVTSVPDDVLPARITRLSPHHGLFSHLASLAELVGQPGRLAEVRRCNWLEQVLLGLWDARHGPASLRDARVRAVVAAIRREPGQRWTLVQAARVAYLSPDHFSRLFTAEMDSNFRTWCLRVRLERARELLLETPMSVTEVARALGYPDVHLFSRQVRAAFGVSPSRLSGAGGPAPTDARPGPATTP